ncbi:MAG: hypothetical protein HQL29_00820 [Candidatus Omnitrophica bacterium]|nr:hypothetical protein [Candidatus Omnitrophota bacterium]
MSDKDKQDALKECDEQLEGLFTYLGKFLYENIETKALALKAYPGSEEFDEKIKKLLYDEIKAGSILHLRGSIEPFTALVVKLFEAKKVVLSLSEDVGEFISMASIHMGSESYCTDSLLGRFRKREKELLTLIDNNMEVIKNIMRIKQDKLKDKLEVNVLSAEEKTFLKQSGKDIDRITSDVNSLVKETKVLFRSIKESYDKDLENCKNILKARTVKEESPEINEEPVVHDEAEVTCECVNKKTIDTEKDTAEEVFTEDPEMEDEISKVEDIYAEDGSEDNEIEDFEEENEVTHAEGHSFEQRGQGLMDAAARRLNRMDISASDKFDVINTVYNNLPDTAPDFLIDIIVEADIPLKKQLLEVIRHMEENRIVELYRRMVLCELPFLRIHGIIGLSRLKVDNAKNVIISAVDDPNATVRRLVANFLECSASVSEMTAIIKLSSDSDETVARVAIRKMGRAKLNRVALINLIPKLLHSDIIIRKEAINALKDITGTDLGYNFSASEDKRREAVARWEELWENNESNPNFIKDLKSIIKEHRKTNK